MNSINIYPSTKVLPYVYRLDNPVTGEFYIGYREGNKLPSHIDLPEYRTSSSYVNPNFHLFNWAIVAEFFDGNDAYDFEQYLINESWDNPQILNKSCFYGKSRFKPDMKRMIENNPAKTKENRIKAALRQTGKTASNETRAKMSLMRKGKAQPKRPNQSESQRGLCNPNAALYIFASPDDELVIVTNGLENFCKENKLGYNSMTDLSKQRRLDYKGWILIMHKSGKNQYTNRCSAT